MDTIIPRLQASLLSRGSSEIDMSIQFLEDAMTILKQADNEAYPCLDEHLSILQTTIWKLDQMSARLEKEATKELCDE